MCVRECVCVYVLEGSSRILEAGRSEKLGEGSNRESIKYAARGCEDTLIKTKAGALRILSPGTLSPISYLDDVYTKGRGQAKSVCTRAQKAKVKAASATL